MSRKKKFVLPSGVWSGPFLGFLVVTWLVVSVYFYLLKKKNRFLLFTSSGDNSRWDEFWMRADSGDRGYDVVVVYYGSHPEEQLPRFRRAGARGVWAHKGSKFNNLCWLHETHPEFLLPQYRYVAVWDDDVEVLPADIRRLFELTERFGLSVSMPSFSADSKLSYGPTRHKEGVLLTFTSMVEMNVPVFSRESLGRVLAEAPDICGLTGYGADHVYMNLLDPTHSATDRFAVVHDVVCKNPHDSEKREGVSEIDKVRPLEARRAEWLELKSNKGLVEVEFKEYSSVLK